MELNKIKGNTYYIDSVTNIGVYVFKNKNCILIDSGINNSQAKKIDEVLIKNGLHPKYIINTHMHLDHCGGNSYFQINYPGCVVYTSVESKLFLENPDLYSTILFSANPMHEFARGKASKVDFILDIGTNKINDEKFEVVYLKGHSIDHIGIITPEKVFFVGDSIFSQQIIEKYSFPCLFNIADGINTLNSFKDIDADYYLISHCDKVLERDEMLLLSEKNIENIQRYTEQILDLLDQPLSREDLIENITILNDISLNFKQFFINHATISAFITYLSDKGLIEHSVENGKLYYFKKPV